MEKEVSDRVLRARAFHTEPKDISRDVSDEQVWGYMVALIVALFTGTLLCCACLEWLF